MKKIIAIFLSTIAFSTAAEPLPMPKELVGKTITMIVPYNPGGDTDATQRVITKIVENNTGLNIVVLNKGGAGGVIGAKEAAAAKPDGLTIFGGDNSVILNSAFAATGAIAPGELTPISMYALAPGFIYVGVNSNIQTLTDLTSHASKRTFTVGVNNAHQRMYIQQFLNGIGGVAYIVPFKTPAEMAIAANQGQIDFFAAGATSGLPFVQANKIRPVATTWTHRLPIYPDATPINTVLPNYKTFNFQMVSAPTGTPQHIINYYNQIFRQAAQTPEFQKRINDLSMVSVDMTPQAVAKFLNHEFKQAQENRRFGTIN